MKMDRLLQTRLGVTAIVGALLGVSSYALNIVLLAVLAWPLKLLWNWAVVPLGILPPIGYAQGFGLLLLSMLLRIAVDGVKIKATLRTHDKI